MLAALPGALPASADPLPTGTTFLGEELKERQADLSENPGMLWVDEGAALWEDPSGAADRACADCHGAAEESMPGVATRYPAVDDATGDLLNLEGRINRCRTEHQAAAPLEYESDPLLALTAFVAHQSRGMLMAVEIGPEERPHLEEGARLFHLRQGQMNLSCANCHVEHAGAPLRGDTISHAVTSGYPAYRLAWQSLGSLHRRLRACSRGVRAVEHPYGSAEYLALELYLAARSWGAKVETPAIRR